MEQNNQPMITEGAEMEIDLRELVSLIWSHLLLIIEAGLCVGAVVFIACTLLVSKTYVSSTEVYVLHQQSNQNTVTYSDLQTGSYLTDDYKELITSLPVLEKVIAQLNLNVRTEDFEKQIKVSSPDDTRIIRIEVEDEDPYQAHEIANAIRVAASAQIAEVMDIEAVNTVQEASYPTTKSGPARMKSTFLGCVLGAVLAAAVLILRQLLDDTIKTADDVETSLGLFVLGSIPEMKQGSGKKYRKNSKRWQHGKN